MWTKKKFRLQDPSDITHPSLGCISAGGICHYDALHNDVCASSNCSLLVFRVPKKYNKKSFILLDVVLVHLLRKALYKPTQKPLY